MYEIVWPVPVGVINLCNLVDTIYNLYFGSVGVICLVRLTLYFGDSILAMLGVIFAGS